MAVVLRSLRDCHVEKVILKGCCVEDAEWLIFGKEVRGCHIEKILRGCCLGKDSEGFYNENSEVLPC